MTVHDEQKEILHRAHEAGWTLDVTDAFVLTSPNGEVRLQLFDGAPKKAWRKADQALTLYQLKTLKEEHARS